MAWWLAGRGTFTAAVLVVLSVGMLALGYYHRRERETAAKEHAAARAAREAREREVLRRESAGLMPAELRGLSLGMSRAEVLTRRPHAQIKPRQTDRLLTWFEEELPNGAKLLLGFSQSEAVLAQVQVASVLSTTNGIAPHLAAMNDTYGTPTGVWDCPDAEGVPTRRFTWSRSHTTLADVFLIYGSRVSITLYVASRDAIGRSLERSRCHSVPAGELNNFPVVPAAAPPGAPANAPTSSLNIRVQI